MRRDSSFEPLQQSGDLNHLVTFTLLNVCSLKRPFHDISSDQYLGDVDLLFLTGYQLQEFDELGFIKSHFSEKFTINFINNDNKYRRTAIGYGESVYLLEHNKLEGISVIKRVKVLMRVASLTIAVTYD